MLKQTQIAIEVNNADICKQMIPKIDSILNFP